MNKNSMIKHFAAIGSGTIVVLLINLLTAPLITRLVSPDEYGVQSVFTMYASLAASILYLGQDQALLRFFYGKEEDCYKRTLLYRCVKYPLLLCAVLSMIFVGIRTLDDSFIEYELWIVICLCIYTMILVLDRFASLLLRLIYKTKMFSAVSIVSRLAYLVISIVLIVTTRGHYSVILVMATVSSAALALLVSLLAGRNYWNFKNEHNHKDCISAKDILRYGAPFIVSGSIASFFSVMDKMAIKAFGTFADVGIYSSALGLASVFAIIQNTFCTLWSPMAFEHYERKPEDKSMYIKGHELITVIVFAAGLTMILCKDIFAIVLGEKYREASYLLPFLIFNPIMYTVSETTVLGLYFMKKTKAQMIPPIVACISNMAGNVILVPAIGIKGAAISTGISYIIFFTVRTFLGQKYYDMELNLKKYYFVTLFVLLYAFYNTFVKFNFFTIIGYFMCIFILIFLYRKTFKLIFSYVKDFVRRG